MHGAHGLAWLPCGWCARAQAGLDGLRLPRAHGCSGLRMRCTREGLQVRAGLCAILGLRAPMAGLCVQLEESLLLGWAPWAGDRGLGPEFDWPISSLISWPISSLIRWPKISNLLAEVGPLNFEKSEFLACRGSPPRPSCRWAGACARWLPSASTVSVLGACGRAQALPSLHARPFWVRAGLACRAPAPNAVFGAVNPAAMGASASPLPKVVMVTSWVMSWSA